MRSTGILKKYLSFISDWVYTSSHGLYPGCEDGYEGGICEGEEGIGFYLNYMTNSDYYND
jgi:hypothetical protein